MLELTSLYVIGYFLLLCLLYNTKCYVVVYYVNCLFIYLRLDSQDVRCYDGSYYG